MKFSPKLNENLKKLNNRNTLIAVGVIAVVILVGLAFLKHSKGSQNKISSQEKKTVKFQPFSNIGDFTDTATHVAISDLQEKQESSQTQTTTQQKKLQAQLDLQKQEIASLKHEMEKKSKPPQPTTHIPSSGANDMAPHPVSGSALGNSSAFGNGEASAISTQTAFRGVSDFTFNAPKPVKTADESEGCSLGYCILPGTFARAVMIGGADANASVNGQSNTTPVVFRVLKPGIMPNNHRVDITGCFVIGTVYGDISSERGEVKLTNISCVLKGKIINKSISLGTAYDISGKEGIRGVPVMRNGKMLWYAGLSGMASGVGSAIAQQYTTTSVSPLGQTSSVNNNKIWQYGGATGAQTALGKLADYYIKRADQYHPVIQLNPGTKVDLMFLSPITLRPGDKNTNTDNQQISSDGIGGTLQNPKFGSEISPALAKKIQSQLSQMGGNTQ